MKDARQKAQEIVAHFIVNADGDFSQMVISTSMLATAIEQALLDAAKVSWPTLEEVELHLDGCMEYGLGVQDCYRFIKSRLKNVEE